MVYSLDVEFCNLCGAAKQIVTILGFIFSGHPKVSLKINFLLNDIENKSWTSDAFESMIDYIL